MQTAATEGTVRSAGSGRIALEQSAATLPGVSAPSSVVRSIMRTARSSAKTLESRLIERLASVAARSSTATWSTEPMRGSLGSSGSSKPLGKAGACAMGTSVARRNRRPGCSPHEPFVPMNGGMKRTMSTRTALVGLAASLAGLAVASVAYFGQRR
jgi:hypothetical protein